MKAKQFSGEKVNWKFNVEDKFVLARTAHTSQLVFSVQQIIKKKSLEVM